MAAEGVVAVAVAVEAEVAGAEVAVAEEEVGGLGADEEVVVEDADEANTNIGYWIDFPRKSSN